jgi:hypothetical protein
MIYATGSKPTHASNLRRVLCNARLPEAHCCSLWLSCWEHLLLETCSCKCYICAEVRMADCLQAQLLLNAAASLVFLQTGLRTTASVHHLVCCWFTTDTLTNICTF